MQRVMGLILAAIAVQFVVDGIQSVLPGFAAALNSERLWDPVTGTFDPVAYGRNLFCAGHIQLPDGRTLIVGGHISADNGLADTTIFDPVSRSYFRGPDMSVGRWYPTVTTLPDGRLVTVAGRDSASRVVLIPEIWENNTWVQLPGASLTLPYYPRDFVAPNGKVFYAGERVQARWLDVDAVTTNGRGKWSTSAGLKHLWPYNRDASGEHLPLRLSCPTGWAKGMQHH